MCLHKEMLFFIGKVLPRKQIAKKRQAPQHFLTETKNMTY